VCWLQKNRKMADGYDDEEYIPRSGNIYRERGREYPELIINIINHNNNPTDLLMRVLNRR